MCDHYLTSTCDRFCLSCLIRTTHKTTTFQSSILLSADTEQPQSMCMTEVQRVHQPQHLIVDSRQEVMVFEMPRTLGRNVSTDGGACTHDDSRMAFEKTIENSYSSSADTSYSGAYEMMGSHSREMCHVTDGLTDKHRNNSTGSFSSVMDFEDDSCRLSVTWAPSVVTETRYRPRVTLSEKQILFYNQTDMQR